ncbi:MAG: serine hydrolase [Geothrix sp.]|nr:serine hydrolase [Geothrix sp.]
MIPGWMSRTQSLLACLGLIATMATSAGEGPVPKLDRQALAAEVERAQILHGLPAMGAAVVRDGKTTIAVAGQRRAGGADPVQEGDAFHLGSDTKAITASVVARLVEHGLLHWGETLAEALPGLEMDPAFRPVTLEMVMRHVAGLPGSGAFTPEFTKGFDDEHWTLEHQRRDMTRRFLARKPDYPPGSRFVYSNYGYIILGHVLERAAGKPWEQLVQEEVFAPLHMAGCGFGPTATSKQPEGIWGHDRKDRAYVPTEGDNPPLLGPAGTVHCPLEAWAKFAAAHAGAAAPGWLTEASLRRLHEPLEVPGAGPGKAIAMGWGVTTTGSPTLLTHAGSNGFNLARIVVIPSLHAAVLVTANAGDDHAYEAVDELSDRLVHQLAPKAQGAHGP